MMSSEWRGFELEDIDKRGLRLQHNTGHTANGHVGHVTSHTSLNFDLIDKPK